jgi:hypothetical protein
MACNMAITIRNGQSFASIREACKALGVNRSTVIKRVKVGVNIAQWQFAIGCSLDDPNALKELFRLGAKAHSLKHVKQR